ncbi:hypothetical protein WDM22_00860 [Bradyrhizobium septentrionale]|uniref:Uncharacterized protein n=1 Tax=Bradyrhizobium septentrionale TaxID=1404411 RepID=A0A973W9V1_9BRAD|nr:hypothetical protein [Bradyrhizobium septentrionale]UGY18818.1 hypothetical protein HAP48_0015985 [Bradyrhizobium septentrionale]UGY27549.1 hypothetical protein HU675_0012730 [Bradyrhizobium septentrionale]
MAASGSDNNQSGTIGSHAGAFSSEVDAGSREENAVKTKGWSFGSDLIRTDMLQAAFTLVSEALERYPDHSHIGL